MFLYFNKLYPDFEGIRCNESEGNKVILFQLSSGIPVHENIHYLPSDPWYSRYPVLGAWNIRGKRDTNHLKLNVVTATLRINSKNFHMWNIRVSFKITAEEKAQYPLFLFLSHTFIQ